MVCIKTKMKHGIQTPSTSQTVSLLIYHHAYLALVILLQEEDCNMPCAQHNTLSQLVSQDNASWFKKEYLNNLRYPVRTCDECKQEFGTTLKVGTHSPVWTCNNAMKKDHACVYALCNGCFGMKLLTPGASDGKRRRKQKDAPP